MTAPDMAGGVQLDLLAELGHPAPPIVCGPCTDEQHTHVDRFWAITLTAAGRAEATACSCDCPHRAANPWGSDQHREQVEQVLEQAGDRA